MTRKYAPICPPVPHMLHGGDYNPDQWQSMPQILQDDYRQMKAAGCNAMTLGVFSWSTLEPSEGRFQFDWLDKSMDELYANGIYTVLATPSGAKPAWLARKYPEVLRVNACRERNLWGGRHNHCYTSPVYREKIAIMNTRLAERYQKHPGLILWHISNEFCGECHCPLCQAAFRVWLKQQYDNDLEKLNQAWWTAFWSQHYADWDEIESPAPGELGQPNVHGLNLDWMRFVTHQTVDYMQHEIRILKQITPAVPVTTNMMGTYPGVNYWKMSAVLDVVAWDNYPRWHNTDVPKGDVWTACEAGFRHDLNRSMHKGKPFLLIESTPSCASWGPISKPKKPGMNKLSSLQAVAHGADSVMYFQWRQSRGNVEKLHGAVMQHGNDEGTRVYKEVKEIGALLKKLDPVIGTLKPAPVAVIYDWENRWALEAAKNPRHDELKDYERTCVQHYYPFWKLGINTDIIEMDCDFSPYKLLIAPMLYMVRPGVGERITAFVEQGGIFVATYNSGIADEHDLCFLNGFPEPLRKVLGIRDEELNPLAAGEENALVFEAGNALGLSGTHKAFHYCDVIYPEGAQVLATYQADFYAGQAALTVNTFGRGQAYFMAARHDEDFMELFYAALIKQLALAPCLPATLPPGVVAQKRTDGTRDFIFLMNFTATTVAVNIGPAQYTNMETGEKTSGTCNLPAYGIIILS